MVDFDEIFRKCQKCNEEQLNRFLVAIHGLFVCLLVYYSKNCEWISMKFSGLIEDGTSNMPLNFSSDPWPLRRFVFVCLLAGLLKKLCTNIKEIFRKIEDGTSNEPLNFGSKLLP